MTFEEMLKAAKCEWMQDAGRKEAIAALLDGAMLLRQSEPALTGAALAKAAVDNLSAVLQACYADMSPELVLAGWLCATGWRTTEMQLSYRAAKEFSFELRVRVEGEHGEWREFMTRRAEDFGWLRHCTCYPMQGKPVIDGFYPLRNKVEPGHDER